MKRTFGIVIGVVSLGVIAYIGARLWAQGGGTAPQPGTQPAPAVTVPRTPVRIVNMSKVVKNYNRWKNFQGQYKSAYQKEYEDKVAGLKKTISDHMVKIQDQNTPADKKEAAAKEVKKAQQQMKEIGDEAKATLEKMQADEFVKIYKDIQSVIRDAAPAAGIELVLFYSDATEEPDLSSIGNIERKLGNGALMPIYAAPNMDISDWALDVLNKRVPLAAQTPPASTGSTGAAKPGPGGVPTSPTTPGSGPVVPTGGNLKPPPQE